MTEREMPLTKRGVWVLIVVIAIGVWVFWPDSPHFAKEDITKIEKSIRDELSKRQGLKVIEVKLIKESDRKLSGFVRFEMDAFKDLAKLTGSSVDAAFTKSCTATMDENWEMIWQCP
jgi:hypothetical protein